MSFTYSPATGRYRNEQTGRFVSEAKIRTGIDAAADAASARLALLTERMLVGDLTLTAWQVQSMAVIKTSQVASAVVAHGGRAQMTPADWGFIGQRIRTEYGYLRDLANNIAAGTVPIDGRLISRSKLYGQSTRVTFEAMRARDDRGRGFDEERSILHPADHCASCIAQAALGWVTTGTLIPIGGRDCLSNCRCTITRRHAAVAAEAA